MSWGEFATRWTIRLALAAAALGLACLIAGQGKPRWNQAARAFWTAGFAVYAAHVAAAFHTFHHWSHAAAVSETARQTRELFGLDWGGGVYFNYGFTLLWLADVVWWWCDEALYQRRSLSLSIAWQAFFIFMVINGAIVFASGPIRWITLTAGSVLLAMWFYARRRKPTSGASCEPRAR